MAYCRFQRRACNITIVIFFCLSLIISGGVGSLLVGGVASAQGPLAPEAATRRTGKSVARAGSYMVSAAHPLATEAGLDILRAGGNAVDAAVAVQLVLGLVEPQSSGLGGGAFLLFWDKAKKEVRSYDGRERAPMAARPDRFMRDGRSEDFDRIVHSGLSIGVPGTMRLLELAHRRHGRLPWRRLFVSALALAERGFKVTLRLHALLRINGADAFDARARRYFFDGNGNARAIGHLLKNPEYARVLKEVAAGGADAFYRGAHCQGNCCSHP